MNQASIDIDPKIDLCFKYVLKDKAIQLALINDFLIKAELPIVKHLTLLGNELTNQNIKERGATLDFLAEDENGQIINIEMQQQNYTNLTSRFFYHFAKLYSAQMQKGVHFPKQKIQKTIIIVIIDDYYTKEEHFFNAYRFLNLKTHRPLPQDLVYFIFLELKKLKALPKHPDHMELWTLFFQNPKKFEPYLKEYPMTKAAYERLNEISVDQDLLKKTIEP